jgi:hypothetical protein|tara:strand:- start:560 stop:712 length:153 start_codon:yes stop_codon:yes gene_type:complete
MENPSLLRFSIVATYSRFKSLPFDDGWAVIIEKDIKRVRKIDLFFMEIPI